MSVWIIFLYILALTFGFGLLVKGADYFVEGAAGLAAKLGISQLMIGLTIVAMGTSAPEVAVSFVAAIKGSAGLAIGNVVGSNILNIWIILGVASVMLPIAMKKATWKYEIPFMLLCTILLFLLGMDGELGLVDGIVLWLSFLAYLLYIYVSTRENRNMQEKEKYPKKWKLLLLVAGGLISIICGSELTVWGAVKLARMVGVSERFIGLTIVALGTSLPELFTSVIAARKGNAEIAIGNIVGSNISNILFILGTTALVTRIPFDRKFMIDTIIAMAACVVLFVCAIRKKMLTRMGGIFMLLCYSGYFVYLCMI